jgi:hypothetical protein
MQNRGHAGRVRRLQTRFGKPSPWRLGELPVADDVAAAMQEILPFDQRFALKR